MQSKSLAPLKHWTLIQRNKNTLRRLITIVHKKLPTSLGKLSTPSQRGRHFVIQFQTLTTDLSTPLKRDLPFRKISLLVIQTGLHFWGQDCSDSFPLPAFSSGGDASISCFCGCPGNGLDTGPNPLLHWWCCSQSSQHSTLQLSLSYFE